MNRDDITTHDFCALHPRLATRHRSGARHRPWPFQLLIACALFATISDAMAIEEPKFTVLVSDGDFGVRTYAPRIVAETEVDGTIDGASSAGFRRIAGYIFGGNRSKTGGDRGDRIAMTAPVTVAKASEKIAMTAPVTVGSTTPGRWVVQFVMPSTYTLQSLPDPIDARVTLRMIPASKVAVVRFAGFSGEAKVREKTEALRRWMTVRGLSPRGMPQLARYNPPWTPPFMRRNEIQIDCE
jgi:SOUL heme-binding protein